MFTTRKSCWFTVDGEEDDVHDFQVNPNPEYEYVAEKSSFKCTGLAAFCTAGLLVLFLSAISACS